jgi:flavin-dependent dehydrogenase
VKARIVVDASGQRSLVARRFGGHAVLDGLANASVFAHYRGAELDPGIDAGSTLIFRLDTRRWVWFIPLPEAASVGLVAPARDIWSMGGTPAEVLDTAVAASEPLRQKLARASRVTDVLAVRDYTYRAKRDGGRGWMLVGDALGFIDPMYSTGLLLTMLSAELGSAAIDRALAEPEQRPDLAGYSTEYQKAFDSFLVLVRAFYSESFRFGEFAKDGDRRRGLVDLITGIVCSPEAIHVTEILAERFGDPVTRS